LPPYFHRLEQPLSLQLAYITQLHPRHTPLIPEDGSTVFLWNVCSHLKTTLCHNPGDRLWTFTAMKTSKCICMCPLFNSYVATAFCNLSCVIVITIHNCKLNENVSEGMHGLCTPIFVDVLKLICYNFICK
jgi:hypothetical protein